MSNVDAHVSQVRIRNESPTDVGAIDAVTREAFAGAEHSDGTEQDIVAALRDAGTLSVSLVAELGGEVVGHVAASPVRLAPEAVGEWFGIGPLSVRPDRQKQGIGAALMEAALERLRERGAAGVVLLGDPEYYRRFGFVQASPLRFPDAPAEYFQAKFLGTRGGDGPEFPASDVIYDDAFGTEDANPDAGQATAWVQKTSRLSRWSPLSVGSVGAVASAGSVLSLGSILSLGSVGSLLSIGSSGSILSIGSTGSILSIGSAGSILSIGKAGAFRNRRSDCGDCGRER